MYFLNGNNEYEVSPEKLVDILITDMLHENVNRYGIEGCLERIEDIYNSMPECRDKILAVYNRIYKNGK